jgi:type II secretory pathway predicted ATPase ExeA
MYEQFFKLQSRPFAATPDPACFFRSDSIDEILSQLTVCVEHGQGIGILTAPAGVGKTLLCQRLAKDLSERYCCILLGNSNFPTRRSLLQAILLELGVEPSRKDEQELRHELRSALGEIHHDYQALVLIVDEAHLFETAVLEEIRTLVDFAEEGQSLVRVILSGQLELEERMTDRQFDAINQRTSAHVYIEALSIAESVEYVRHRIQWAGGKPDEVFSDEGILIIARASCGVPRCLNQLADHSLLLGFAADESPVSESTVREALEDLKQLPLHWNDVNDADRMLESHSESSSTVDADLLETNTDETSQSEAAPPADSPGKIKAEAPQDVPQESHVESESGDSDTAAPFAVFEFGGDDSPETKDEEGDTLDEVAAEIHVPRVSSADESITESEQAPKPAGTSEAGSGLSGQPSPPVSEICGVVLDLSSEVCGVSEYQGRTPKSAESEAVEEAAQGDEPAEVASAENAAQSAAEDVLADEEAGVNATAVFEFGAPEEPTEPVSTEVESAEVAAETTDTKSEHEAEQTEPRSDEAAPTEENVLAEIASAESEIAEVSADIADAESDHEAEQTGERSEEAAPTEDQVLAEIASVEREIAEVTAEFDLDSEPTSDADPVVVLDENSKSTESFEATAIDSELDNATAEESAVAARDTAVEFEVVSDPYSLIQEPLSAGIVWDVPAVTEENLSQEIEETTENPNDAPETVSLVAESTDGEKLADSDSESSADNASEDTTEANWIESEDAIFELSEQSVSEELGEAIMRDWAEDLSEPDDEQLDVVEAPAADLTLFDAEAGELTENATSRGDADVEPMPAREVHPDRYIDAIVPMLGEIDDQFQAASHLADTPERPAGDIEAELVEAISQEDAEVEDEIGAAVLDLRLETQWSLQQDRVERDESSDENSLAHSHLNLEPERYDIVEPEEPAPADSFLDQVSEISRVDLDEPATTGERAPTRRPFGQLFSDLRRRGT